MAAGAYMYASDMAPIGVARPYTPQLDDKPLPSLPPLPSPTLTNPDMVLPDSGPLPALPSPSRNGYGHRRPPSLSYLKDITNEDAGVRERERMGGKREKMGLMSRKMMLLRSRSGEGNGHDVQTPPRSTPDQDLQSMLASSPTIMDGVSMAEGTKDEKRMSVASSFDLDDYNAIPAFLSKYNNSLAATDDEYTDTESPAAKRTEYSPSIVSGMDAQRKAQEEEEQNSAMLSRRAEQILANAKKRLNLMEGNLRGARDLVAPLTAANLKRATSLGSSPGANFTTRRFQDDDRNSGSPVRPFRTLHAQASSPTMGRDFHQGHIRVHSETQVADRPRTALDRNERLPRPNRIPVKPHDPSCPGGLRGTRSYESLGDVGMPLSTLHVLGSPDPNLGPVPEDDDSIATESVIGEPQRSSNYGSDIVRPGSTTEDLREQMSSLKGRISNLRERAREDSMRRQSMNSLRNSSPLNNATHQAPEMWYTASPSNAGHELSGNAGFDHDEEIARTPAQARPSPRDYAVAKTGSRNAFVEQISANGFVSRPTSRGSKGAGLGISDSKSPPISHSLHKRTASGTAIVESAEHRYSHHESAGSREMPGSFDVHDNEVQPEAGADDESDSSAISPLPSPDEYEDYTIISDIDDRSVYEDADDLPTEADLPTDVVAHEDREDAFDYEHFFLHSAMATYHRSSPAPSELGSTTSVSTARGPVAVADQTYDENHPPPTPETPEALRVIERKLQHSRTMSADSVSTVASFATAAEGIQTPTPGGSSGRASAADWPIPASAPTSAENSRPSTAIRRSATINREPDAPYSRADSGVELPRRPASSGNGAQQRLSALSPKSVFGLGNRSSPVLSPPMSPTLMTFQDPTTVAVQALLDPTGHALGLKDKALIFGLVESLRKVCGKLQEDGEGDYDLRRRLEEAKRVLRG